MGKWKAAAEDCLLCGESSDIVCPDCGEPMCGACVRQDVEGTWRCTDCIGRQISAEMARPRDTDAIAVAADRAGVRYSTAEGVRVGGYLAG